MSEESTTQSDPLQLVKTSLLAYISSAALQSKDLGEFLIKLTEFLKGMLAPKGWGYVIPAASPHLQYALGEGLEAVVLPNTPKPLFERALQMALERKQPVIIGLDSPGAQPEEKLNPTAFIHYVLPLIARGHVVAVMHFWFDPGEAGMENVRVHVLDFTCNQIDIFLNTQGISELVEETTKLSSYIHLLEELSGDQELKTIGWNLVNYARETNRCSRVSLFTIKGYSSPDPEGSLGAPYERTFQIQACSGLRRTNPRSEHAVILAHLSQELLKIALGNKKLSADGTLALADRALMGMPMAFAQRDASRRHQRHPFINEYFERMPMHWACILPLLDGKGQICAAVLFEGQTELKNPALAFQRMRITAHGCGPVVASALKWEQKKVLKFSNTLNRWIANLTPAKKKILSQKIALSFGMLAAALLCPLPYRIRGSATLTPAQQITLTAPILARLEHLDVHVGQTVQKGEVLAQLSTTRLDLELAQAEKRLALANTGIDQSLNKNQEAQLIVGLYQADQAAAYMELLGSQKEKATLTAPFGGTILGPAGIAQKVGEVFFPGSPVIELANLEHWTVRAELRQQDFAYLEQCLAAGHGPMKITLDLLAEPGTNYDLTLERLDQLTYGSDPLRENFTYYVTAQLDASQNGAKVIKSNFLGDAVIYAGWKPVYYILFNDFCQYLNVRDL